MEKSKFALVSLILGIISFVQLLGVEKGTLGIVFGILALREITKQPELKGRKMAIIGIVLSALYVVIVCVFFQQIKEFLTAITSIWR
ncbi:MAG: DUF4190 domain-containing protein [Candidatus Stahlbacteria bacterium]|nr:DUF4190 domain-containing protein [Candidatus Stahlbacteria bacterium]